MDFRGATSHFADPDFDGEPVQIYEPHDDDSITPPDDEPDDELGEGEIVVDPGNDISITPDEPESRKFYVNGVLVTIIAERVKYLDGDGNLITESLRDYSKRAVTNHFASLDTFLKRWKAADRKQAIIDELEEEGLRLEPLAEEVNPDLDPFDLICHVAYDRPPLTRRERAENVRKRDIFAKYGLQARAVLDALLEKYQDDGIVDLGNPRILQIPPIDRIGTPVELIRHFGSRAGFEQAVHELQDSLYEAA
jgi:type I restriction enzyme R subunit